MANYQLYINFKSAPSKRQLTRVANKVGYRTTKTGNKQARLRVDGTKVFASCKLPKKTSGDVMRQLDKSLGQVQGYKSLTFAQK